MNTNALKDVLLNVKKVENLFATNKEGLSYVEPLLCKNDLYIFLEDGGYSLSFVATGDVEIYDPKTEKLYRGDKRFENKDLVRKIKNGEVYNEFDVKKSNGFDIYIYDEVNKDGDIIDAFVFDKPIFNAIDLIVYLINVLQTSRPENKEE